MIGARNIPEEIRPDVIRIVERNEGKVRISRTDLEYLFGIYNRYCTREPEDINCSGCRSKVSGKMRLYVNHWKEQNLSDENNGF